MVTLLRVQYVVFFLFAWMGEGGGSSRGWGFSPASIWCWGYVEGVCGVCAVGGWFTASPGLSQTDWTLAGWGCTPVVHEQSWHPG